MPPPVPVLAVVPVPDVAIELVEVVEFVPELVPEVLVAEGPPGPELGPVCVPLVPPDPPPPVVLDLLPHATTDTHARKTTGVLERSEQSDRSKIMTGWFQPVPGISRRRSV